MEIGVVEVIIESKNASDGMKRPHFFSNVCCNHNKMRSFLYFIIFIHILINHSQLSLHIFENGIFYNIYTLKTLKTK